MRSRSLVLGLGVVCWAAGMAAQADVKSDALIKKAQQTAKQAKTLQAEVELKQTGGLSLKGTARFMKPNYGKLTIGAPQDQQLLISDGQSLFRVMPEQKLYQKVSTSGQAHPSLGFLPGSPLAAFFKPEAIASSGSRRYAGTRKIGGVTYQQVVVTSKQAPQKQVLYFAPSGWYEGMDLTFSNGEETQTVSLWLKKPRVNAPMTAAQFAYTPPADFSVPKGPEESLLAVGATAPDFLLAQPGGGMYSLEQARKGKKAVLVNFWFHS